MDYEAMVRRVIGDLQRGLDDPPTFRELAARYYVSPYHFHRIFRAIAGESPAELTRRLRLERGAWEVRNTSDPISDIAFRSGYATHEAFTKAFQTGFGMPPSVFRAGLRDCPGIRSANGVHFHPNGMTRFHLAQNAGDAMKVDVVDVPATRRAAVRHQGPYVEIGAAFGVLEQKAAELGLGKEPDAIRVAIYYDDPDGTPAAELRSVAAVSVPEDADIGDLDEARLPTGKYLRAEFTGHYAGLEAAWGRLYGEYVAAGGYAVRDGVNFEVYVNDHSTPPDQLRTDLYLPIE